MRSETKTVWDSDSLTYITVESLIFTGRGAGYSLVPERSERTSPVYDQEELGGICLKYLDRRVPRNCLCGCGQPTTKMSNGMYRVYAAGHNKHINFRSSHVTENSEAVA